MCAFACMRAFVRACVRVCVCVCGAILATTECFNKGLLEPQYEKTDFWHMRKTKTQICFAVTAKLICAFVFTTRIVQSLYLRSWSEPLFSLLRKYNHSTFYTRNFKPLAIFCSCTARYVSDLVGNPKDWFSYNEVH